MYSQIDSNKRKTVLLITLFILFIVLLGWIFQKFYPEYGYYPVIFAILISLLMSFFSYFQGDKLALKTTGAKGPIKKTENAYVYRMVENLSIAAGIQTPKIYIIEDASMNAFATGRDPAHASIALTSGIINNLENEELEGVIAHELSHIKNYDIRLMMVVIVLVGIVALLSDFMIRIQWFGNRKSNNKNSGQMGIILIVIGVVLAILSPLIAQLIKLAVSRKREFLADANAALLTRYPKGLANALKKISHETKIFKKANNATAHLFIANPFGSKSKKGIKKLFSTHPPIEERIKALNEMI